MQAAEFFEEHCQPWKGSVGAPLSFDALEQGLTSGIHRFQEIRKENLLADPVCITELDYHTITDPNLEFAVEFSVGSSATGHGFAVWFESEVWGGLGYSGGPDSDLIVYGTVFLPWSEPVSLEPEDRISAQLQAQLVGDDYIWIWESGFLGRPPSGSRRKGFRQSSFDALPLGLDVLRRNRKDFAPVAGEEGVVEREALTLMNGERSNGEIAHLLSQEFPARFCNAHEALTYVSRLSVRFSR